MNEKGRVKEDTPFATLNVLDAGDVMEMFLDPKDKEPVKENPGGALQNDALPEMKGKVDFLKLFKVRVWNESRL